MSTETSFTLIVSFEKLKVQPVAFADTCPGKKFGNICLIITYKTYKLVFVCKSLSIYNYEICKYSM